MKSRSRSQGHSACSEITMQGLTLRQSQLSLLQRSTLHCKLMTAGHQSHWENENWSRYPHHSASSERTARGQNICKVFTSLAPGP